jgi:hypothetical protein
MGFLRKIRDRVAEEQRRRREEQLADEVQRAGDESTAAREREAAEALAAQERVVTVLGRDLAEMEVNTAADAKLAIKLAKLRKRELQAEKRALASEVADAREQWRERQAGRMPMTIVGRGTGGRLLRGAVQANRRSERMKHADRVNAFSDARQELDEKLLMIDRLILELERKALGR